MIINISIKYNKLEYIEKTEKNMRYDKPIKIGKKELKNRYIIAPVKTAYASLEGEVNERHLRYYDNISKGGAGLIIVEPVSVCKSGKEHPKQLNIDKDDSVENLKKLTKLIKANGSIPAIHLNHAGRGANKMATKMNPLAPSSIMCPMSGLTPDELTIEQIDEILQAYKEAIKRAKEAGFEAIEIQCGHGALVHQFLSPRLNKRDDIYGQDRTLFLKKILSMFEGSDEIIRIIRISGSEFVEGGWTPKDNKVVMDLAKEHGFDMVHCGFGNACDTPPWYYSHMALPEAKQKEAVKAVKEICPLPLAVVGRMADVEKLKEYESEDLADLIAFGRPVVADQNLVNKLVNSQYDKIDYCGYCLQGCLYNVKKGVGLGCIINPEIDKKPLHVEQNPKRIAVIGAGPAGMSAAITLSKTGHKVTLFEKTDSLGGNFQTAPRAIGKESMSRPLQSMIKKCQREVSDIRLNSDITKEDISGFEYFIVASGSHQNIPEIKGLNSQNIVTSLEYFYGQKEIKGKRVLILGAGMVGMEVAENLVKKGFDVTITKRGEEVGNDMEPITKKLMMMRLKNSTLKIMTKTKVKEFKKDSVSYEKDGQIGEFEPFDTVLIATGLGSDESVPKFLKQKGVNFIVIGDAKKVENIFEATKAGYEVALEI